MLQPSPSLIRRYGIPAEVIDEAFTRNPAHRKTVQDSLASVIELCRELRVLNRHNAWWWRSLGLDVTV
jgi:hypothetical protein